MIFSRPVSRPIVGAVVAVLAVLLAVGVPAPLAAATAVGSASTGPADIDIEATPSLSFVPDAFSVAPGESVHLVVTQEADFDHTFTLASFVNYTIPETNTSAELAGFFNAHPPIVNISLGSTVGAEFFVNFTAPAVTGTYEFVCLIHFPTMTGVMTVSSSSPSSGSAGLSPTDWIVIGAVLGVVLIAGAAAFTLRRRGARPPGPAAPP